MLFSFVIASILFFALCAGIAWPWLARRDLAPVEKIAAVIPLSLLGVFAFAWVVYVAGLPVLAFWILPPVAAINLASAWREWRDACRDPAVRQLLIGQLLVSAYCVAWLATIASYSGGGWAGDWIEHWERTRFFLERWPEETKFIGFYPLTARPPLANVVTGALLTLTRVDFAHYQLITTLLSSLTFIPAALLAARWNSLRSIPILAVLLMVNPLFVQNSTFAWTKLATAAFVLTGIYFFLRAHDNTPPRHCSGIAALCLAAAMLTHYSAGPYIVMLAIAWFVLGRSRFRAAMWRRETGLAVALGAMVLATWFAWSLWTFGPAGTLLTNSSVTTLGPAEGSQLNKVGLNIFDTIVPHNFRSVDQSLISQRSAAGEWRDWFFQSYQLNLLLAFGSVAWLAVLRELTRHYHAPRRAVWATFIGGVILLGIATHGDRDHWGLTHICLQPLVVLGLARLAASWPALSRPWQYVLVAGATVDLMAGVVLHFGVQSLALDRWLHPALSLADVAQSYNGVATMNLHAKMQLRLQFFSDVLVLSRWGFAAIAGMMLSLAVWRARTNLLPVDVACSNPQRVPSTAVQHE